MKLRQRIIPSLKTGLLVCVVFCITMAFIDVLLASLLEPLSLSSLATVVTALAIAVVLYGALYLAGWLLVGLPLTVILKLDATCAAISCAALLASFVSATMIVSGVHLPRSRTDWIRTGAACAMALLLAVTLYPTIATLRRTPGLRPIGKALSLGSPFVAAAALVYAWLRVQWLESFVSPLGIVCGLVFLAVTVVILIWAGRTKKVRTVVVPLVGFGALIVLTPVTMMALSTRAGGGKSDALTSDHPIKRVILLTVDTLRPDALSCYGGKSVQTPHIDHLAHDGITFSEAVSAAPWTLPGVVSLMTGLSPSVHLATRHGGAVPPGVPTLAERMQEAGYYTVGIGENANLRRHSGLGRGFAEYYFDPMLSLSTGSGKVVQRVFRKQLRIGPSTDELTDLAIGWLEAHRQTDFFLWLHYFDPHIPYAPPAQFLPKDGATARVANQFSDVNRIRAGHFVPNNADRARIQALYLAEVRYVDAAIGRIIATLQHLGMYDETLIVLTSDHAEEFWEHGGFEHGHSLYREVLHVPLIVKRPGPLPSSQTIAIPVSTQGVMPTILDICGIGYDAESLSGCSLKSLWSGAAHTDERPPAISTGLLYYENRIAAELDGFKYIKMLTSGHEELFNHKTDLRELRAVADTSPDALAKARDIVARHEERSAALRAQYGITKPEQHALDEDTRRRLRALGYLE